MNKLYAIGFGTAFETKRVKMKIIIYGGKDNENK